MDYKKIKDDFDNGTLDREKDILVIDNDICWMINDEDDDLADVYEERYGIGCGYADFKEILTLYGINCEYC